MTFDAPNAWQVRSLGACGTWYSGGTPSTSNAAFWNGDLPWISASSLHEFYISDSDRRLTELGAQNGTRVVPENTILFIVRGMSLKTEFRVGITRQPVAFGQDCKAIIPSLDIDPLFLANAIRAKADEILGLVDEATHGTGRLQTEALAQLEIDIPSLPEQRATLNRKMNETLEVMALTLFKSWFVDFDPVHAKAEGQQPVGMDAETAALFPDAFEETTLGKLPRGWRLGTLGELCPKPSYGFTASANDEPIGPKFLRITDINKLPWIEWLRVPYCQISSGDYEKYKLRKGDLLIARMADPGHGVLIEEEIEGVFASYLIRFRPKEPQFARYLQYWLKSDAYWELVSARQTGTTRASLNAVVLSGFTLLIPPNEVVKAFSSVVDIWRSKINSNVRQNETITAMRDTLLPKLMSGEIAIKGI
jgi:type I restriction enzyme S subunit